MRRIFATLALAIAASTLAGCLAAGPCMIEYRDTVVHLTAVVDSATGTGIDSVFITNVTVNGDSLSLFRVAGASGLEVGVLIDGDTLRCRVPSAFGYTQGRWEVKLLARGYPLQTVAFDASYAKFKGGCPGYLDRGSIVVPRLSRAQPQ